MHIKSAAAPSVIWLALPAVITPPSVTGFSPDKASRLASYLIPSSLKTISFFPSAFLAWTGRISLSKYLPSTAAAAFWWLLNANLSKSSLDKFHLSAISSAPLNCEKKIPGYLFFIPSESNGKPWPASKPSLILAPIGTIDITSTPPPMTTSWVPDITAWIAKWMACWDDPHCRSTEVPGTDSGRLDERIAFLATFPDCAPTWSTHPKITSSINSGSIPDWWTNSSSTFAPKSAGCHRLRLPFFFPPAVLTAETI